MRPDRTDTDSIARDERTTAKQSARPAAHTGGQFQ